MADKSRQPAAQAESRKEVAPRSVRDAGVFKSRMRRVRSTSLLIHSTARAIASNTAASTNHGHV
jgi:hypothetical protein